MLTFFRRRQKTIFGLVIIVFMVILMAGFGIDSCNTAIRNKDKAEVAARVDKYEISLDQFQAKRDDIVRNYRDQYGASYEQIRSFINVDQQAIDTLITEYLLQQLITKLGLSASPKQIEEQILSYPVFSAGYNESAFRQLLQSKGMSAEAFENDVRRELASAQLADIVNDLSVISEREARSIFVDENSKFKFSYIELAPKSFLGKVDLKAEDKIKDYFDRNQERYRRPRAVRYTFVKFDPVKYSSQVEVTPEDIEHAYQEQQAAFTEPRKYKLRRIFLKTPADDPAELLKQSLNMPLPEGDQTVPANKKEELKKKAQLVLERLKNGEKFSDVAAQVSEDKTAAQTGGDLGWISAPQLDALQKKAVASLVPGEFSGAIDTPDGVMIIMLEEVTDPKLKPLDEVRVQIEADLRSADAPIYANEAAEEFYSDLLMAQNKALAELSKEKGLQVQSTNEMLTTERDPDPTLTGLTHKALTLTAGSREKLIINKVPVVITVDEVRESAIPSLAEVHNQVIEHYKEEQSQALAKQQAENLLKAATEYGLSEVAKREKLELRQTDLISREDVTDPLFSLPDFRTAVFALSTEKKLADRVLQAKGSSYLVEVDSITRPNDDEFKNKRDEIVSNETRRAGTRSLAALVGTLRAQANIWINEKIFDSKRPRAK